MKQQSDSTQAYSTQAYSTQAYLKLCTAIINSGVKCNDTEFLNSEWYEFLKSSIDDWNEENDVVLENVIPKLIGDINKRGM